MADICSTFHDTLRSLLDALYQLLAKADEFLDVVLAKIRHARQLAMDLACGVPATRSA